MKSTLLLFILILSGILNAQLTDSLKACYSFSGDANDESGNAYHGTVNNATFATDRFSNLNSAYSFNGSTASISLPSNVFLYNNYSYSAWVRLDSVPAYGNQSSGYVISIGNTGGDQAISVQNNSNWIGWSAAGWNTNPSSPTQAASGVLPTNKTWYHLVAVRNDSTLSLYVDGQQVASTAYTGTVFYSNSSDKKAMIGDRTNGSNFQLNGVIDDVRIYNRPLTDTEITMLYTAGSQLTCASHTNIGETLTSNDFKFYPNPGTGVFQLESTFNINSVEVLNVVGQKIFTENFNNNHIILDLSSQPNGIYFINVKTEMGEITKKLVLEN